MNDYFLRLSEDRRKRLQDLEKQLAENRRKLQELKNLEKTKLVNEKEITKLRSEILVGDIWDVFYSIFFQYNIIRIINTKLNL